MERILGMDEEQRKLYELIYMAHPILEFGCPNDENRRHERVACHCFMSFGLCDENGTASCGYKSQPLSARQTKKSPWQYSLEVFQGIPPRIFLTVP